MLVHRPTPWHSIKTTLVIHWVPRFFGNNEFSVDFVYLIKFIFFHSLSVGNRVSKSHFKVNMNEKKPWSAVYWFNQYTKWVFSIWKHHCFLLTNERLSLVLLDLSTAFDTIDHKMLLDRLSDIGVQGMAHKWFQFYLQNRYQSVIIKRAKSKSVPLRYGVPQGSVLSLFFLHNTQSQSEQYVGNIVWATSYMLTTPRFMLH